MNWKGKKKRFNRFRVADNQTAVIRKYLQNLLLLSAIIFLIKAIPKCIFFLSQKYNSILNKVIQLCLSNKRKNYRRKLRWIFRINPKLFNNYTNSKYFLISSINLFLYSYFYHYFNLYILENTKKKTEGETSRDGKSLI